jgi:hypothetical protein
MIRQITKLSEFLPLVPRLVQLFDELDGLWEPDLDKNEFVNLLVTNFQNGSLTFIDFTHEGELKYVAVLNMENSELIHFWLFYMNKKFRTETKDVIQELIQLCKERGFKKIRLLTTRLTSSYDRWIEKFGGKKFAIMYQVDL